jgi:HEAT repeats
MASESQPNDRWDRVASQLRACREAQEQAWGGIDNATLGRFIADDLNSEERRQVEQAIDKRPELRRLTDLVRDVLADFDSPRANSPAPQQQPTRPRPLPFPKSQPERRPMVRWLQKRSGMLAAACLLLALSTALFDSRFTAGLRGASDGTDEGKTSNEVITVAMKDSGNPYFLEEKPLASAVGRRDLPSGERYGVAFAYPAPGVNRLELLNHKIEGLQEQGKWREALAFDAKSVAIARRANLEQRLEYAANRELVASVSQHQGDLDHAYGCLTQAFEIRMRKLGSENKETARTALSIANIYAVAINSGTNASDYPPAPLPASPGRPLMMVSSKEIGAEHDGDRKYGKDLHERLAQRDPALMKQRVVPIMVQGLENASSEKEREQLVLAIGNLGPNAADAAPALSAQLRKVSGYEMKKTGEPVLLSRPDANSVMTERERCVILWAIGRMGPSAREAVPALVESLQSTSPEVRRNAADALGQLVPNMRDSVASYVKSDGAKAVAIKEILQRLAIEEKRLSTHGAEHKPNRDVLGIVVGPPGTAAKISQSAFGD